MKLQPSFIAELYYRTAEEGGRSTPAFSGIRPAIKFPFDKMLTSGQQIFIGQTVANPGDTVKAEITIIARDYFKGRLSAGLEFAFGEGTRITGTGKILEILDEQLTKKEH